MSGKKSLYVCFKKIHKDLEILNKKKTEKLDSSPLKPKSELQLTQNTKCQSLIRVEERCFNDEMSKVTYTEFEAGQSNDENILSYEFHGTTGLNIKTIEIHYKNGEVAIYLSNDVVGEEKNRIWIGVMKKVDGSEQVQVDVGSNSGSGVPMWLPKNLNDEDIIKALEDYVLKGILTEEDIEFVKNPQFEELIDKQLEGLVMEIEGNEQYSNGEVLRLNSNQTYNVLSKEGVNILGSLSLGELKDLELTNEYFKQTGERLYNLEHVSKALFENRGIESSFEDMGTRYFVNSSDSLENIKLFTHQNNTFEELTADKEFRFLSSTRRGKISIADMLKELNNDYFKIIDKINGWTGITFTLGLKNLKTENFASWKLNLNTPEIDDYKKVQKKIIDLITLVSN